MIKFAERLKEVMNETNNNPQSVAKYLGLNQDANIYQWLEGNHTPKITNLIQLANLFQYSIDYLLGLTDNDERIFNENIPEFKNQFKKVLKVVQIKQKNILEDKILSCGHLTTIRKNKYLLTENMIKLANYLGVSIDFLIGRI